MLSRWIRCPLHRQAAKVPERAVPGTNIAYERKRDRLNEAIAGSLALVLQSG